jgi:hypothetical protein
MTKPAARDRLTGAAFALFDERGYGQTIAGRKTGRGEGRCCYASRFRTLF